MSGARTIIRNAWLLDLDPLAVRRGELRIEGRQIVAVGERVEAVAGDVVIDAGGAVVMPGLVNGHTHLYSALAVGMPPPPHSPRSFQEILEHVWWRLDRALDLPLVELSATIGALDALHCGTTTLIDHHASPHAIDGSLDAIESGLQRVGLRGVLCYETTDRNGREGRDAGLKENERYLERCAGARSANRVSARQPDDEALAAGSSGAEDTRERPDAASTRDSEHPGDRVEPPGRRAAAARGGQFAGLAGAHAAFTMSDDSILATADLARHYGVGVHIHVAEDPCDAQTCREQFGADLLDRLEGAGILELPSVLAHGTHLSESDLVRINAATVSIAHNTRSNMNNAVGYAPLSQIERPIQLGTDGIGGDMLAELGAAWFKSRDAHGGLAATRCIEMLASAARRASQSLGTTLGKLARGAAADLVVTDYFPATPLTTENAAGHLIFALRSRHVRHVMVGGEWKLRDRLATKVDEADCCRKTVTASRRLWDRMSEL